MRNPGCKVRLTILLAAILAAQTSQAQYPPACPPVEKVVVCGDEPLFEDGVVQRETAITMAAQGCNARLLATWMDKGQCHQYTNPQGGEAAGGWTAEQVAAMPDGCELAAWYATQVPQEEVLAFVARLLELMDESPELFDEPRSYQFLECICTILE